MKTKLLRSWTARFARSLSPDGKQLAYITRFETETGLRLRNLETGDDRWVKYPITRDDQESRFTRDVFPGFAFLPDGKEIVYNQDGKIRRLDLATGKDKIIPFTAQVSQDLGPKLDFPQTVEEGPVKVRLIMDPVESPDSKKLAFSAMTHLYTHGFAQRQAAAPDQRKRARISAGVVAGWKVDRVCDVVERRRATVESAGGWRHAGAIVEVARRCTAIRRGRRTERKSWRCAAMPTTAKTANSMAGKPATRTSSGFPPKAATRI